MAYTCAARDSACEAFKDECKALFRSRDPGAAGLRYLSLLGGGTPLKESLYLKMRLAAISPMVAGLTRALVDSPDVVLDSTFLLTTGCAAETRRRNGWWVGFCHSFSWRKVYLLIVFNA